MPSLRHCASSTGRFEQVFVNSCKKLHDITEELAQAHEYDLTSLQAELSAVESRAVSERLEIATDAVTCAQRSNREGSQTPCEAAVEFSPESTLLPKPSRDSKLYFTDTEMQASFAHAQEGTISSSRHVRFSKLTSSQQDCETLHCSGKESGKDTELRVSESTYERLTSSRVSPSPLAVSHLPGMRLSSSLGYSLRSSWVMDKSSLKKLLKVRPDVSFSERKSVDHTASQDPIASFFPIHPESFLRLIWDIAAAVLLTYDIVTAPLSLFDLSECSFYSVMDLVTLIFWTTDMPVSALTGTYMRGELVMQVGLIARKYAKSFLIPDTIACMNDWLLITFGSNCANIDALPLFRALPMLRLLRVFKVGRLLDKSIQRYNSPKNCSLLNIAKNISTVLVVIHIFAGLWFAVGQQGWVQVHVHPSASLTEKYFTSVHWSMTQLHGSMEVHPVNLRERVFAVVVLFSALIVFSWFVSSLTEALMMLQSLKQEKTAHMKEVNNFLLQHGISRPLCVRVKEYLASEKSVRFQHEYDIRAFDQLPLHVVTELHEEVRGQLLDAHEFLGKLYQDYPRLVRQVCHEAMREEVVCIGESVFEAGESCSRMLFVERGVLAYAPAKVSMCCHSLRRVPTWTKDNLERLCMDVSDGIVFLRKGDWVSEPAVWTHWETCGGLGVHCEGFVQALHADEFAQVVQRYEKAHTETALYAQDFVRRLNNRYPSDLHVDDTLAEHFKDWSLECALSAD